MTLEIDLVLLILLSCLVLFITEWVRMDVVALTVLSEPVLRYTRASRLSVITFVTPLVALSLGALVRAEPITATTIAGAVLVVLGVALVVRTK